MQHLSEIESNKRDPRLSSIERIDDAMELAVMLVPEDMAPDICRYIASQGRFFTSTQSNKETLRRWVERDRNLVASVMVLALLLHAKMGASRQAQAQYPEAPVPALQQVPADAGAQRVPG